VGISNVMAELKPEDKASQIARLQHGPGGRRNRVAMVGDGVNDAPALAQADLGVALGTGSDVAVEAAGVVLMTSDLRGVAIALDLSRFVFARIRLNMAFSLGFNALGIPIAAGALFPWLHSRLPPEVAALAMALSSVSVVTSSLLLRLYRPPSLRSAGPESEEDDPAELRSTVARSDSSYAPLRNMDPMV
jgi:Cu+-exporting ATPase